MSTKAKALEFESVFQSQASRVDNVMQAFKHGCHCDHVETMWQERLRRGVNSEPPPMVPSARPSLMATYGPACQQSQMGILPGAPQPPHFGGFHPGAQAHHGGPGCCGPPGHGFQGPPSGHGQPNGGGRDNRGGAGPPGGDPYGGSTANACGAPNFGPKPLDIYSKLFDIKLAQQAEYQYHGIEGGMAWRQKIRNYFVGQCPDCEQLLNWAEAHDGVITLHEVRWLDGPTGGLALDQSALVVAGHVWTFLGVALKGKAEAVYNTGGEERIRNGMEAWRKIYAHIVNSTKLHNMGLRDQVYGPREARQYGDVTAAINDWESTYRDFRATGGGEMGDYELKMTMTSWPPR